MDWYAMCELVGIADLLSDDSDDVQSRESVELLFTCHLRPTLTTFALRTSEVFVG